MRGSAEARCTPSRTGHNFRSPGVDGWPPPTWRSPRPRDGRRRRTRLNSVSYTPGAITATAQYLRPSRNLWGLLEGLLEPDVRKRAGPGSEGGPGRARRRAYPTRAEGLCPSPLARSVAMRPRASPQRPASAPTHARACVLVRVPLRATGLTRVLVHRCDAMTDTCAVSGPMAMLHLRRAIESAIAPGSARYSAFVTRFRSPCSLLL
jgi:hypothetical protein